jgi:pyruvate carboxylase
MLKTSMKLDNIDFEAIQRRLQPHAGKKVTITELYPILGYPIEYKDFEEFINILIDIGMIKSAHKLFESSTSYSYIKIADFDVNFSKELHDRDINISSHSKLYQILNEMKRNGLPEHMGMCYILQIIDFCK